MACVCFHGGVIYHSIPGDVDRGMYVLSQGRIKYMTRPGFEPRTPRRPCEYSDH